MDLLLTFIILTSVFLIALIGGFRDKIETCFMSKDNTKVLKAISCIIVIMVHIPVKFENPLQNLVGSFGYICVTLFFLFSAYGMSFSISINESYLKNFWRNRLSSLLIPCFLVNIAEIIIRLAFHQNYGLGTLIKLNSWVAVLLQFCLIFYVVQFFRRKNNKSLLSAFYVTIGIVAISTFIMFLFTSQLSPSIGGWCVERMGFIYGIFIFVFFNKIKIYFNPSITKILIFTILSVLLGVFYLQYKYVHLWGDFFLRIALCFVILTLVLIITSRLKLGNKTIFYLGSISYEIYLSHWFVLDALTIRFPNIRSGMFIISTVLLTIIISSVVHIASKQLISLCRIK